MKKMEEKKILNIFVFLYLIAGFAGLGGLISTYPLYSTEAMFVLSFGLIGTLGFRFIPRSEFLLFLHISVGFFVCSYVANAYESYENAIVSGWMLILSALVILKLNKSRKE